VARKKVSAAFGGRITTDGGVMLLAQAERRLGIANQPTRPWDPRRAPCEPRHPSAFRHLARPHLRHCLRL
jgi:hypothetical protein